MTPNRRRSPPRFAEGLLRVLLGHGASTHWVLAELREEYRRVARERPWGAPWWYLVQAIGIGARVRWSRRGLRPAGMAANRLGSGRLGMHEISIAIRLLLRRPMLSGTIVMTVGLAIAATTMAFSLVDGVLLEALPYRDPERLVAIWERHVDQPDGRNVVSPANVIAWREGLRSVDRLASLVQFSAPVTGDGEPEQVGVLQASADYFDIVGAVPLVGRFYTRAEDHAGGPALAVLTESYWRRRYGGGPGVVGATLVLSGSAYEVVGVLPDQYDYRPRFGFGAIDQRDVVVAPRWPPGAREAEGRFLQVIGRLGRGETPATAQAEISALATRLALEFPTRQQGWGVSVLPLHAEVVGDVRELLWLVFGSVAFVLVIACSNIANLLLTRAAERRREMAVRNALGAGRHTLIRQLLIESGVLSVLGGLGGLLLAWGGVGLLRQALPDLPRIGAVGIDGSVVVFVGIATLGTVLLFGLVPTMDLPTVGPIGSLAARGSSGGRRARWMRSGLVVAQVTLSFVLLVGAGVLVRSLANRLDADVGIDVSRVVTAAVSLAGTGRSPSERAQFFEQAVERLAVKPGIVAASAGSIVPMSGGGQAQTFWALDRPTPPPGQMLNADVRWVHRDYHRVMGVGLVEGRYLATSDREGAPVAVLVNESGARRIWPGERAVGKRLAMVWGDTLRAEVMGVVADVRLNGPDDVTPRITLYWDHRQARNATTLTFVGRGPGEAAEFGRLVGATVKELDPRLPVYNVRTMAELFGASVARSRFTTVALATFAALALLLAALGLYAVMAYSTAQRRREIGIRMALGANRRSVRRLVAGQALGVVMPAVALGAIGALLLGRLLQPLAFGVAPTDPSTFAAVAVLVSTTAVAACWIPMRRAARIDPMLAIRDD